MESEVLVSPREPGARFHILLCHRHLDATSSVMSLNDSEGNNTIIFTV
jgi:hypothetical protein